jgi:predicted DNA-binding transcriptional regulator YafY
MNPVGRAELSKAIALVQICDFFKAGGSTTVEILADQYGKSPRAINRWLADIDRHLIPLTRRGTNYRKWEI